MKTRFMDRHDSKLFQEASGFPRIVGYKNKLEDYNVTSLKGVPILFLSVKPLKNNGKPVFRELNDEEQFTIEMDLLQLKTLKDMLEKRIRLLEKRAERLGVQYEK